MFKILVIGDSCRDVFHYVKTVRLAPDLPIPILEPIRTSKNPGMAMNVKRNIEKLNGPVEMITNNNWEKITKTRIVDDSSNHTFVRIDAGITPEPFQGISSIDFEIYDAIMISDYNKGFLSKMDIEGICKKHPKTFLDTKKPLGDWANFAKYIKINEYEYLNSGIISEKLKKKLIVTAGGRGAFFRSKTYKVKEVSVVDTSGAGDSFFAAMVWDLLRTGDIESSIAFANEMASEVVRKRGVSFI
jgi:bifunctional ADP-heptose synthase (sugar kinase/adenylyltransferase)